MYFLNFDKIKFNVVNVVFCMFYYKLILFLYYYWCLIYKKKIFFKFCEMLGFFFN